MLRSRGDDEPTIAKQRLKTTKRILICPNLGVYIPDPILWGMEWKYLALLWHTGIQGGCLERRRGMEKMAREKV